MCMQTLFRAWMGKLPRIARDEVTVGTWNKFVDICENRRRGNWDLPVGSAIDIHEYRDMQDNYPVIRGMRTLGGVTARLTLRVWVLGDGNMLLVFDHDVNEGVDVIRLGRPSGSFCRVFKGNPQATFDFLNELYDIGGGWHEDVSEDLD